MRTVGDLAPEFALFNQDGYVIKLSSAIEQNEAVIVYFYPQAGAPGCAVEAKGFRDVLPELTSRGIRVIGVTTSSEADNRAFAREHSIPFDLVSDPFRKSCEEWGTLRGDNLARMTFVVDNKGRITHHFPQVNVWKHPGELAALLSSMPKVGAAGQAGQAQAAQAQAPAAPAAQVASAPAQGQAAPAQAPVAAAPSSQGELIVATARAALQLLLSHQQAGGAVPADVVELAQKLGPRAQS
ncbi:MAG: peroxiredoxin [Polyangia bacterium]